MDFSRSGNEKIFSHSENSNIAFISADS